MRVDLTDQVAIVTGSAHRVGKVIALELARRGVHILVHYGGSGTDATETVREIKSLGVDAFPVQADLSKPEGVEAIFAALKEHFGRLNILVNSASNFQERKFMDITLDDWQETLNINLTAPFLCTQAAVPIMRQNDPAGGVIINIVDKGVKTPWLKFPHHGISKAALWSLTEVSAATIGPDIRANAVLPGPVLKPAGSKMSDEDFAKMGKKVPLERTGTPEDVARAVAYLASEDYLNGVLLEVNGGEHLW